jgi:hypothetical protein
MMKKSTSNNWLKRAYLVKIVRVVCVTSPEDGIHVGAPPSPKRMKNFPAARHVAWN